MTVDEACSAATPCGDGTTTTVQGSTTGSGSTSHNINIKQSALIMGINYDLMSFIRTFNINENQSGDSGITAMVSTGDGYFPCTSGATLRISGSVSENCVQSLIIPMYLNLTDKIFVYEKRVETIQFSVGASPHVCYFQTKWGLQGFAKYVVKAAGTEYLQINQEFHVVQDGVDNLIHSASQNKNPFQDVGVEATWGLYGNAIYNTNAETPDPTVRQILVYPIVPSGAIPWDRCGAACAPSVNNYGFYDYNAMEGGFTPTTLGADDGGKDFYYPYWLRQMTTNSIMRELADIRWAHNWLHENIDNGDWTPPEPATYSWPFGSFVKDSAGNYIHSAIFTDINGVNFLYNKCSPLDIFDKISAAGGGNQLYCPVTLVSNVAQFGIESEGGSAVVTDPNQLADDSGQPLTTDSGDVLDA